MPAFKCLAAAAVLAAPLVVLNEPARALTARQYAFQGQGLYLSSKGVPQGYVGHYGRGYYLPPPPPPPPGFYGIYGYGHTGPFRPRPYFYGY